MSRVPRVLYKMNWRSHVHQLKAYAICILIAGACFALMVWQYGTGDMPGILRICGIMAAIMIGPALLLHLWYMFLNRGVTFERTEHGSFAITYKGERFTFIPQEMERLIAYKSPFLTAVTHRRMPWDRLHYYDLVFKERNIRLNSLVVEDLERVLRMPPEKVMTKTRFMAIP